MKNKREVIASFFVFLALSGLVIYGTFLLYKHSYFDSVNAIMSFSIGIVSLAISAIALMISLSTYLSIDSVNALSSMEGNVLCNENYNAEYQLLVDKYSKCTDQKSLEAELYNNLYKHLISESNTCMQFTDRLQEILDHLLWYAYVDTKTPEYKKHITEMVEFIDTRYNRFNSISNGNQYLLKEHIKLIKSVLNYQSLAHDGSKVANGSELLNIRGKLFLNAVSKTIYYDYLGLEYHKKALSFLQSTTGFKGEEFLQESIHTITNHSFTEEEKLELDIYLSKAQEAFELAQLSSQDDILWKGYITFNKARVDLLSSIVNKNFDTGWDDSIRDAITSRYTVLKLLAPAEETSFLLAEFRKEYYYAQSVDLLMRYYLEKENTNSIVNEAKLLLNKVSQEATVNQPIFARTTLYLNNIIQ